MKEELSTLVRDPELEKLGLSLNTPNLFGILKITNNELRHSNFLAWLLTPKESHNLGSLFLKWFLKEVFSFDLINWASEFTVDSLDLINVQVHREWKHIDILIDHNDFVIAIENKVRSGEGKNQLSRYLTRIKEHYPNKKQGFVFLTLYGQSPENETDQSDYIPIGYNTIKTRIEIVLDVYKDSISNKVKFYIEDYLLLLNREIMMEHESIDLARELYKNHKQAIDFIIEHKPDRISEIRDIIETTISNQGYELQTCNKYYARFLTKKLVDVIPRTGHYGWKGEESFLFELEYNEKGISLKFVISPGNEHNRTVLKEIGKTIPNGRKPTGKKWLTYYSAPKKVNLLNDKYEDEEEVVKLISNLLQDSEESIKFMETKILKRVSEFD